MEAEEKITILDNREAITENTNDINQNLIKQENDEINRENTESNNSGSNKSYNTDSNGVKDKNAGKMNMEEELDDSKKADCEVEIEEGEIIDEKELVGEEIEQGLICSPNFGDWNDLVPTLIGSSIVKRLPLNKVYLQAYGGLKVTSLRQKIQIGSVNLGYPVIGK